MLSIHDQPPHPNSSFHFPGVISYATPRHWYIYMVLANCRYTSINLISVFSNICRKSQYTYECSTRNFKHSPTYVPSFAERLETVSLQQLLTAACISAFVVSNLRCLAYKCPH